MPSRPCKLRVVKLGGSLLRWPAWRVALAGWDEQQPASMTKIVVGGGVAVDAVRAKQTQHRLSDERAHWLAIDAMRRNAQLVARLLDCPLSHSLESGHQRTVLDPEQLLRGVPGLPNDWDFTSDSIAAWVATLWQRSVGNRVQLTLLKSVRPNQPKNIASWAEEGLVDARFERFARGLDVECVSLREHLAAQHFENG